MGLVWSIPRQENSPSLDGAGIVTEVQGLSPSLTVYTQRTGDCKGEQRARVKWE